MFTRKTLVPTISALVLCLGLSATDASAGGKRVRENNECLNFSPMKATSEQRSSFEVLAENLYCTYQITDQERGINYSFVADGKTVTELPKAFIQLKNAQLQKFGVEIQDAVYITKLGDRRFAPNYMEYNLLASVVLKAKIIVPVTIELETDSVATHTHYNSSISKNRIALSVSDIRVKSIKGLPQRVAKYVSKAIELAGKIAKGGLNFQLQFND